MIERVRFMRIAKEGRPEVLAGMISLEKAEIEAVAKIIVRDSYLILVYSVGERQNDPPIAACFGDTGAFEWQIRDRWIKSASWFKKP